MFTGERVIPGEVEPDLWNEHVSRYHFAALFAAGKSVLDAGCGTGYGTALLAQQATDALGFDISPDAISYALGNYPAARFLIGSASAFPAPDASAGLVTAFEIIEHLPDWQALIEEAHRVLQDDGVFLLSTSNQLYYSETRQEVGSNPFHVHEFESHVFEQTLARIFPFVRILAQNHQECTLFAGEQATQSGLSFIAAAPDFTQAHFFVAVCAKRPVEIPAFTYVPSAANLLRELDDTRTDFALTRAELTVTRADLAYARTQLQALEQEREFIASSRWLRLGRKFNLGPDLAPSS